MPSPHGCGMHLLWCNVDGDLHQNEAETLVRIQSGFVWKRCFKIALLFWMYCIIILAKAYNGYSTLLLLHLGKPLNFDSNKTPIFITSWWFPFYAAACKLRCIIDFMLGFFVMLWKVERICLQGPTTKTSRTYSVFFFFKKKKKDEKLS